MVGKFRVILGFLIGLNFPIEIPTDRPYCLEIMEIMAFSEATILVRLGREFAPVALYISQSTHTAGEVMFPVIPLFQQEFSVSLASINYASQLSTFRCTLHNIFIFMLPSEADHLPSCVV